MSLPFSFRVFMVTCILAISLNLTAQQANCIDLSDLHAPYIHCTYGNYNDPYHYTGIREGQHTVITQQYLDHNTGNRLFVIPNNENYSIRLGNELGHHQGESLSCDILIDTTNFDILILKYAAVLESADHTPENRPRFMFDILNMQNQPIDTMCLSADFIANSSLGWNENYTGSGLIYWKDWTLVGVDVSRFHGETIKIRMTTNDCGIQVHFGYAYFTLACDKKRIETILCGKDDEYLFSAPSGFSYRWFWEDDPAQTLSNQQIASVSVGDTARTLQCHLSSIEKPDCGFDLYTRVERFIPVSEFEVLQNECTNQYTFINQSFISHDGIHPDGSGQLCHDVLWNFGDGQTSTETSPTHSFLPGDYTVTMTTGLFGFHCTDSAYYSLHVIADSTFDIEVCDSYSWNDVIYTESGIFMQAFPTVQGCDSLVTMNLDVEYTPAFSIEGNHWVIGGSEIQWNIETYHINMGDPRSHIDTVVWSVDCPNWQTIPTDNGLGCELHIHSYLLPTDSVALHAQVHNRCGIVEQTFWIHTTYYGVEETNDMPVAIAVFPNPNLGQFSLKMKGLSGDVVIELYDCKGAIVKHWSRRNASDDETVHFDSAGISEGIYSLRVHNGTHSLAERIVVNKP